MVSNFSPPTSRSCSTMPADSNHSGNSFAMAVTSLISNVLQAVFQLITIAIVFYRRRRD
ncbi:uncharacterized protein BDR25DRAFT_91880 [Lindgomyces ingoldianus]|uniref:Uncharacterized protein n=1 Tax=Lindgomyces ingoldianus TaxID=673940 RepID=A0ACB6QD82_9PLEO|nr:uncharacterized protein BDR25DRAFT_91880 [Lindgomyces ingoldianus]KAF2464984.1 hypothetical protein BDR25DRAFT_91880 [Lindgomyces ingoldianus]